MEPIIRRPSRSDLVRNINRDVLLGFLIPGRDRFEVRGWVRLLIGDVRDHVPDDSGDQQRFEQLQALDDPSIEHLRKVALAVVERVPAEDRDDLYRRGVESHDRLMRFLLGDRHLDAVHLSAFVADVDRLLEMLKIDPDDLKHPAFMDGFRWANESLADAVKQELDRLA